MARKKVQEEVSEFNAQEYFINVTDSDVIHLYLTIANCVENELTEQEIEEVKNAIIAFNTNIIYN